MEEFEEGDGPVGDLVQCCTCKRRFFPKVLEKHSKICKKSAAKKRKVFDSSKQRAEGTDIPVLKPLKPKFQGSSPAGKPEPPSKPSNWRRKHEDFIATIRAAKALSQAEKEGKPLPPPPPPTHDPDYTQCPYCQRRFNKNAAERHINFCKEQAARMPNKGKPGDVRKPTNQYKPPATARKSSTPPVSAVSSASSRLPQRSGYGQSTGIPSGKVSSAGSYRNSPSGVTSPPSGGGNKTRIASSGYGAQRNSPGGTGMNKKNRMDSDEIQVDNGGVKGKFCHSCGSKYPVESAKFCCECGVRRMLI
ncbi:zinc finger C2HC domain-containing protein 1A isoform 1-T1 [Synchiropus picturatus]